MEEKNQVRKRTKICRTLMAFLITAMGVGFMSCSKEEKEPDISLILGKWYFVVAGQLDTRYSTEFNSDNTFSYSHFSADYEEIHGVLSMITVYSVSN